MNLYAYAGNNPVAFSDPFALCHERQRGNCTQADIGPEKAYSEGNNVVIVRGDGHEEVRSGGSRSWRNNNPGNMRNYDFAQRHGSIGEAGGANGQDPEFAVFSNEQKGAQALGSLMETRTYQSLTVDGAVSRYAPPADNNTAAYQQHVRQGAGLTGDTRMSALTGDQLQRLVGVIRTVEKWTPGTVTNRRP